MTIFEILCYPLFKVVQYYNAVYDIDPLVCLVTISTITTCVPLVIHMITSYIHEHDTVFFNYSSMNTPHRFLLVLTISLLVIAPLVALALMPVILLISVLPIMGWLILIGLFIASVTLKRYKQNVSQTDNDN